MDAMLEHFNRVEIKHDVFARYQKEFRDTEDCLVIERQDILLNDGVFYFVPYIVKTCGNWLHDPRPNPVELSTDDVREKIKEFANQSKTKTGIFIKGPIWNPSLI
jgi:hypothetical protein